MELLDLVRTYKIPENLVKQGLSLIDNENIKWGRHTYSTAHADKPDDVVTNGDIEPLIHEMNANQLSFELVAFALDKYIEEFNYASCTQFSSVRFNRYKVGQEMLPHTDAITSLFSGNARGCPICSIVGLLRGCEQGGEFIMRTPDGKETNFLTEDGTVLIFPSTFAYEHFVRPVKKGVRDSYVAWSFF